MHGIQKVVIPAAGLGSRFLPYTKTIPKEMLPLINKPALQSIIEECVASAANNIVLVTNKDKASLTDHFKISDRFKEIAHSGNQWWSSLNELEQLSSMINLTMVEQAEPLGLGHAIWVTRSLIQNDYFGICLPDDVIFSSKPGLLQLIELAQQQKTSVIAVQEIAPEMSSSYGVIGIKKQMSSSLYEVSHLVEKPLMQDAPSNLAIVGRYVLSPIIFTALENISSYAHGELQLTDAISRMLHLNERVLAYKIQGDRYDIGTPLGWIKAVIGLAWNDPLYGPHIQREMEALQMRDRPKSFQELPSTTKKPYKN